MDIPLLNRKQMPGLISLAYEDTGPIVEDMLGIDIERFISINLSKSTGFETYPLSHRHVYDTFFKADDEGSLASDMYVQYTFTEQRPNTVSPELLTSSGATVKSRLRRLQPDHPSYLPEADDSMYSELVADCPDSIKDIVGKIRQTGDTVSRVRLAGVAPGHSVKLHRDHDPTKLIRLHIPIKTDENCVIECENSKQEIVSSHLQKGGLYVLNTGRRHAAINKSNQWRIHLLIDVRGQQFVRSCQSTIVID